MDLAYIYRRSDAPAETWWSTVCDGPQSWSVEIDVSAIPAGRDYAVVPARGGSYGAAWSHGVSDVDNVTVLPLEQAYVALYPSDPTRAASARVSYGHARTGDRSRRITFAAVTT